jgi:DNA-binding response OmpR family regulator
MRVAVLDDNQNIGEMLKTGLELGGHAVDVYYSPSKFLADMIAPANASAPYDLIIVDLLLIEGTSGVEVVQRVWNTFPGLPVILITAGSFLEVDAARRVLPAATVLRKPFRISTLLTKVREFENK